MRKFLITLFTLIFLVTEVNAQLWKLRRYEATVAPGTTQLYGDIGGFPKGKNLLGIKDFSLRNTRFNITAGFKYRILEDVSVRLNLAFGLFHSTDMRGSNEERGFESKTLFFEPSLLGEYYFIKNKVENSYLSVNGKKIPSHTVFSSLDFYAFTGFGGLFYKVTPNEILAPNTTATSGFTPVIPVGAGVNYFFSGYINFGIELSGRFTFSDNIDGYISTSSSSNDVYYFLNFTFTYKLTSLRRKS
jgi:hypothetical protein